MDGVSLVTDRRRLAFDSQENDLRSECVTQTLQGVCRRNRAGGAYFPQVVQRPAATSCRSSLTHFRGNDCRNRYRVGQNSCREELEFGGAESDPAGIHVKAICIGDAVAGGANRFDTEIDVPAALANRVCSDGLRAFARG